MDKEQILREYANQIYQQRCGVSSAAKEIAIAGGATLLGMVAGGPPLAAFFGAIGIGAIVYRTEIDGTIEDFEQGDRATIKKVSKTLMSPRMRKQFIRALEQTNALPAPVRTSNPRELVNERQPEPERTNHEPNHEPANRPDLTKSATQHFDPAPSIGDSDPSSENLWAGGDEDCDRGSDDEHGDRGCSNDHDLDVVDAVDGKWFKRLSSDPWHYFVYGSTGDGKSTLVCNILSRLCSLFPNAEIVIIDPKYPYSEWGEHKVTYKGDHELLRGIKAMGAETARRLNEATRAVEQHGGPPPEFPPIVYVLDEANTAYTDHGQIVGDNLKRILSRGRALNVWGVFVGTSCNVGDYGVSLPDLFNTHRLALRSLAPLAINRDDTLTKEQKQQLQADLKEARRHSDYLSYVQSEGRDRTIEVLPPPLPQPESPQDQPANPTPPQAVTSEPPPSPSSPQSPPIDRATLKAYIDKGWLKTDLGTHLGINRGGGRRWQEFSSLYDQVSGGDVVVFSGLV